MSIDTIIAVLALCLSVGNTVYLVLSRRRKFKIHLINASFITGTKMGNHLLCRIIVENKSVGSVAIRRVSLADESFLDTPILCHPLPIIYDTRLNTSSKVRTEYQTTSFPVYLAERESKELLLCFFTEKGRPFPYHGEARKTWQFTLYTSRGSSVLSVPPPSVEMYFSPHFSNPPSSEL